MSHHFDSPSALADGRVNPCDLYVFPAAPGTTALIVTVNPDAGRSSPTTFRPDALYELVVAGDSGTSQDIAFRVTFTEPDEHGQQRIRVRRASGPAARHGTAGTLLGEGRTGEVFTLDGSGLAWAGLAADPFTGDGVALGMFLQGLREGHYVPEVFTIAPSNTFAGRDVTAVALQVPDAALGGTRIAVWGRISLYGHAPQRQVSRIGQPMLRPLFFNPPDTDVDALNVGTPAADRDIHGERVRRLAATVGRLAGLSDPDAHAQRVMAAFLPDVLGYRPGQPAAFYPGDGNGRALGDHAFAIAVAVLAGSSIATTSAPRQAAPSFPYLSPIPAGHAARPCRPVFPAATRSRPMRIHRFGVSLLSDRAPDAEPAPEKVAPMTVLTDADLYLRGAETLLASWQEYARGATGAAVQRSPGVATAVFPNQPERAVYNNALLERDLAATERADALDAMEAAYAAAGVTRFAAWGARARPRDARRS